MMTREMKRLGDYIFEYSVRNKSGDDIPVYSVTNTNGFCTEYFDKDVASKDQTNYKIVSNGYFAYNPSRINVGSIDCQRVLDKVVVSPLYVVFGVNEQLDPEYLLYFLKSDIGRTYIGELASGSVRANLKFSILQEFMFPMVSLEKQKENVDILNKLNAVLNICDRLIKTLDDTVKSRFIEMFAEDNSSTVKAEDIIKEMRNGLSPSLKGAFHEKVLTLSAITQGNFDITACKEGSFDVSPPNDKKVNSRDFYICRGNGNIAMVGIGAYADRDYYDFVFPDTVIAAKVDLSKVTLPYLSAAWKQPSVRRQIEKSAHTTNGTYKINQKIISKVEIKLPPIAEQEQFSDFVVKTDKSKLVANMIEQSMRSLASIEEQGCYAA